MVRVPPVYGSLRANRQLNTRLGIILCYISIALCMPCLVCRACLQACGKMLADDYDLSAFTHEDGVAALHVAAMLLDARPSAAGHMVSVGAVPMFLSRYGVFCCARGTNTCLKIAVEGRGDGVACGRLVLRWGLFASTVNVVAAASYLDPS